MKELDLDELLSEPRHSSAAESQSGDCRQQDAGASERAAQSPATDAMQDSSGAQPVGDAQQLSSSSMPDGIGVGIGGNNDIVTRLKSRNEQ
jgi:hypothetical protein